MDKSNIVASLISVLILLAISVSCFCSINDNKKYWMDFLWVVQAFFRGKVLRQKAYRPLWRLVFGINIFHFPYDSIPYDRVKKLVAWWGFRFIKVQEMDLYPEITGISPGDYFVIRNDFS